jgi:hypothetical protein
MVPGRSGRGVPVPDHIARAEFRDSGGRPSRIRDLSSVPESPNVGGPGTVRFSNLSTVLGLRKFESLIPVHYLRTVSGSPPSTVLQPEYLLYPFCDEVRRFSPQDAPGSKRDRLRLILTT